MSSTRSHDVTVLLIEDEAEIRRFLRSTLPAHGYRLYEATTGADGLAQASAHYLRVYMRQLRNKIEADPAQPRHLVTELGVGYRLRTE
ncbi:MAG: hypothetical protein E8D43_07580 [Nitrospira sp.]|nr:MAG: hypothetical protein E8D43_07580 [Nitrospira sp.]